MTEPRVLVKHPRPKSSRSCDYSVSAAITHQGSWSRPRAFPFGEGLLTVDDDRTITVRALHPAPFATREVMRDLTDPVRIDIQALQVVNDDVSMRTFAQRAAILEAG